MGLSGSKDEDRTFTAEENLEVISGMKPTLIEHTSKAIVKADGTGIAQTTICKPSGNDKFYTLDGKQVKPSHKGIVIAKGKKYANK